MADIQLQEEITSLRSQMGEMQEMLKLVVDAVATSFLSPADVADRLNIDRKTVLGHLNNGLIKGKKISGEWRIPATEIIRLLREAEKNHFKTPVSSTRLSNLLLNKQNESTTRKAKRTTK